MKPPVIIIGAGRSGTNALRDALCTVDNFHTWPCDEINYVWRSGNRSFPTDELRREHARPDVKAGIEANFERRAKIRLQARIVEKTCANSLRVGFVDEVFPDAQFLHLVRDGRAVVASAVQRWTAPLNVPYLVEKARFVPPFDLPYYGMRYLRSRLGRVRSADDRLSWWGPRFEGMERFDASSPLAAVAAEQWLACVTRAREQLAELAVDRVHSLSYRELVTNPTKELAGVFDFLGEPIGQSEVESAAATLHGGSLDSWRQDLDAEQQDIVCDVVGGMNDELGFGVA